MNIKNWFSLAAVSSLLAIGLHATPVESGLVLRLDASTVQSFVEPPTEPLPLVTSWPDRSGHNHHALPVESVDVPRFTASATPAGSGVVTFDGSVPQFFEVGASATFDGGQYTVYSVFRTTAMNQGRILNSAYLDGIPQTEGNQSNYAMWGMMPGPSSMNNFRFQTRGINANANGFTFVVGETPNQSVTANQFYIGGGHWDATTGEVLAVRVNSSGERVTGTGTGANAMPSGHVFTRIGAGSSTGNANTAVPFSGDIAELLVFNRVLNASERQAVEDYLYARHFTGVGSPELSVTDDLILWLDAAETDLEYPEPEGPKTRVTEWTDLSGNSHHAQESPMNHQFPTLLEGVTPMGGDAVSFDGTSEFLEIWGHPDFDGTERSWYAVFRATSLGNNGRLINGAYSDIIPGGDVLTNYATWGIFPGSNNTFRVQARRAAATDNFVAANAGSLSAGEFFIGGGMWDSNSTVVTSILVDGAGQRAVATADEANAVPEYNIFLRVGAGAGTTSANPTAYFHGEIAEILVYNRLLTEEEQLAVENYLREKHFGELPTSGYAGWVQSNFDPEDWENEELTAPDANPSGDGISNYLKYAMALSPWENERANLPSALILEDALLLTYRRSKEATDVTFIVEVSPDLVEWSSGPDHVEEIDAEDHGDYELVTAMALHYPGEHSRGFMRLRIEAQE